MTCDTSSSKLVKRDRGRRGAQPISTRLIALRLAVRQMPGIIEEQPSIPIIDLSDFESRKVEISQQLLKAARDVGFFYITGHQVPDEEVDRVFNEVRSVAPACRPMQCLQSVTRSGFQLCSCSWLLDCRASAAGFAFL